MSWIQFKLYGETIKEHVVWVSIIVAGYWANHTFGITERGNIDPFPIVEATINLSSLNVDDQYFVKSTVVISNKGNDDVWVELSQPSLSIRSIGRSEDDTISSTLLAREHYQGYLDTLMLVYGAIERLNLSEGSQVQLVYLTSVSDSHSLIHATFMAPYRHAHLRSTLKELEYNDYDVFTAQASEYLALE